MKERIFYYVFLIAGLSLLLYFAPKEYCTSRKLIKTGIKTQGTVVDMVRSRGKGYKKRKYPVFEYTDGSGNVNRYERKIASIFDKLTLGDVTDLVYDPATKVARQDSFYGLYFGPLLIFLIGSIFTLVGRAGVLGKLEQYDKNYEKK